MSLGEYLCMYLFAWSDVLWPIEAMIPNLADVLVKSAVFIKVPEILKVPEGISADIRNLKSFRTSLQDVRRVFANIPSYTIFDDHEVTDDWNMTLDLCLKLHGTPLGRRVVQSALVAYSLCQHWGNVPEQFRTSPASLPGTKLLTLLDGHNGTDYSTNSPAICSLVSVHTDTEIKGNGSVYHEPNSLIYNYVIEGLAHRVIVTDTRTFRSFPRGGAEAPDLLSPWQMDQQFKTTLPLNRRALLVVISTNAPPVETLRSATEHDWIANHVRHFPDIHDAWEIPSIALDRFIKTLSDQVPFDPSGRSGKVILLSGDVHIGFASRLHYRATNRFEDTTSQHANVVIAQLVASSFKKQTDDTIGLQREGYTYAPHWYVQSLIYPHITEYYVGWNVPPDSDLDKLGLDPVGHGVLDPRDSGIDPHDIGTRYQLRLRGARSVRLPPYDPVTLRQTPHFEYQLDYLTMTNGGGARNGHPTAPADPRRHVEGGAR